MMKEHNDISVGFEPLGLTKEQSQSLAQHILEAAVPHVMGMPDHDSTLHIASPIHVNLVSVGKKTLRAAGLSDVQIGLMSSMDHPLSVEFYDGPDSDRFTFLHNGLEIVAGILKEQGSKTSELNAKNSGSGTGQSPGRMV